MFKRGLYLVVFLCFLQSGLFAQKFMHSVGGTFSVMFAKEKSGGDLMLTHTDLTWFPRYNLIENENSSFSIGAPVSIGVSILRDMYTDEAGFYWGYDLPVVLDYNFGCKSTRENDKKFGGYFGGGFGYNFTSWKYDGDNNAVSYGPIVRTGIRCSFKDGAEHGTFGLFFKQGLETQKFKTVGLNILYDF